MTHFPVRRLRACLCFLIAAGLMDGAQLRADQTHTYSKIFDGGADGYHTYRIPSLVKTNNGTLIAFCEGRVADNRDWGDIDLVCKRSTDHGATWSALRPIEAAGPGSWTNPTAVNDATFSANGRVWLFFNAHDGGHTSMATIDTWGERRTFATYSDDHGLTWAPKVDLTATLTPKSFTWDAVGPGIGIQLTQLPGHAGWLVVPATRRNFYSKDHGATWQYQLLPDATTGEGTIVERDDGTLLRNDRPVRTIWANAKFRRQSHGSIEGAFTSFHPVDALPDPACEGSILRYDQTLPGRILFLNSADPATRLKMRIRMSYDGGRTWPIQRFLYDPMNETQARDAGKGGYSSLVTTGDGHVGALVEACNTGPSTSRSEHFSLDFHKMNLDWIRSGAPEP